MIPFSDADVRHSSFPVVNVFLIGLNALVFLYELTVGGFGLLGGGGSQNAQIFFLKWGFIPEELTRGVPFTQVSMGVSAQSIETPLPTWTTIFSSMFIHGGFMHFAGNMMFLWVFGDNIEDRLGHMKYLVFYLVAGVAATLSQLAIDPHSLVPLVGASGAISGVLGAYLLLYPYNRVKVLVIFYLITVIRLPAMVLLGLWFLWQLVQGIGSLGLSNAVNVAFFAHVGGFLAGAGIMVVYKLLTGQPIWPSRPLASGEYRYRS